MEKNVLIELTTYGSSETEVIMITDKANKHSVYIYTNEPNFEEWVKSCADDYKKNGYNITNNTALKI